MISKIHTYVYVYLYIHLYDSICIEKQVFKTKGFRFPYMYRKHAKTKRPTGSLETSLGFWLKSVGLDEKHIMKGPGFDVDITSDKTVPPFYEG